MVMTATDAAGLVINQGSINANGDITATTGPVNFSTTEAITLNPTSNVTALGNIDLSADGGIASLSNLFSENGDITLTTGSGFTTNTQTESTLISTANGGGDITFNTEISQNGMQLNLTSGTGDITFERPVGANSGAGDIIISVANNVTVNAEMNVASFYTSGIDGTLTLNAPVNSSSPNTVQLGGRELFVNSPITTTNGGNVIST